MSHSLLSPSSAIRWMKCPGSVALSYGQEDEASEYADEGTAAHTLAAWALSAGNYAVFYLGQLIPVLNDDGTTRRTFTVDADMADNVQVYVDAIRREPGTLLVEQRVDFSDTVGVPDQKGTSDAVLLDVATFTIGVHDLKFGRGVKVYASYEDADGNVAPNEQLALYGLGTLAEHELTDDWQLVKLAIHQPRIDHYDEYIMTVQELKAWGQSARAKAAEVMSVIKANGEPIPGLDLMQFGLLVPGEKQCKFCRGAAVCPALKNRNHALVMSMLDEVEPTPETVQEAMDVAPVPQLPQPEDLELLEIFLTAARSRIQRELQAGHAVPGWKLVQGKKGNRAWLQDQLETIAEQLKKWRYKTDEIYDMKLLSPAQCQKLLKDKATRWEALAGFITQSEGGEHVAPESDPRPAIEKANVSALLGDDSDLI